MEDLTGITGNSYVVVDLQKIKRNVEKIRAHIGENVKFLPVLKGATCGHGLEEIAEFLVSECQFDMLCVGHTIEAERIRNFGVNCDILVLGGTPFNNIPYVVENKITTTLSNADYARALSAEAVKRGLISAKSEDKPEEEKPSGMIDAAELTTEQREKLTAQAEEDAGIIPEQTEEAADKPDICDVAKNIMEAVRKVMDIPGFDVMLNVNDYGTIEVTVVDKSEKENNITLSRRL